MPPRELHFEPKPCDLVLRFPPNWTAVFFLSVLGCIHLFIAVPAFLAGRFEGEMSLLLGSLFLAGAVACRLLRSEMTILPGQRLIRESVWLGRTWYTHAVAFDDVREVRLFLAGKGGGDSRMEVVCEQETIECPPTRIPRQQALHLAITLDVALVKICADEMPAAARRLDELPHPQEFTPDEPH